MATLQKFIYVSAMKTYKESPEGREGGGQGWAGPVVPTQKTF